MSPSSKLQAALFATAIILAAAAFILVWQLLRNSNGIARIQEERFQAYQLADGLRQTSDDLTRMARLYAITGDARYQDYFQEILAIRNGAAPRPDGYFRVYWDFVVATGQKPRTAHNAVSLDQLASDVGFEDREFALLRQSEENSNRLAELEQQALAAQTPAQLEQARQTLHGPEYHQEKARIMQPLDHLLTAVAGRADQTLATRYSLRNTLTIITLLLLLLSGLLATAGLMLALKTRPQT